MVADADTNRVSQAIVRASLGERQLRFVLHTFVMDFMQRALELAENAAGGLSARPPVGAVIVAEDGRTVLGEGATQPRPGPHAEAAAIADAGGSAIGATMYCTLEPHQTNDTTPSCANTIIDAGIARVICPTIDPNPAVRGRGFEILQSAGVEVINDADPSSKMRANELIEGFAKHIKSGMPFVTVKWAMSLDGKIATRTRDSKWVTSQTARAHAHRLRYRADAVMTGIGTVVADNPRLTARDPITGARRCGRPRLRVVVDSQSRMPTDAALLKEEGEIIHAVATERANETRCHTLRLPGKNEDRVDLSALLSNLGERGYMNVLVEAGETLTGALFDLKLVDKVVAYVAIGKIIGGNDALMPVGGLGPSLIKESTRLRDTRVEHLGDDIAIIGYVDSAGEIERCSAE